MPQYSNSPFKPAPRRLQAGFPEYLIGSYNFDVAWGKGIVTADAISSNVATVTVQFTEGNVPAVGDFISIFGTSNGAGEFNVTHVALASVSITQSTGIGTLTFALTGSNQSTTADAGMFSILPAETAETINANYTSVPCTYPIADLGRENDRTITLVLSLPTTSSLSVSSISLQGALSDIDAEYTNLTPNGTSGNSIALPSGAGASTSAEYTLTLYRFFRVKIAYTSGSGTLVAKVMV